MKEQLMEWVEQDNRRKKIVFWAMSIGGFIAIVIGVVSIAILAVAGLFLLVTGIGSFLVGRHLLTHAKVWRERHLTDSASK